MTDANTQELAALDVGGILVNDTSIFRVDHMPYGGNRMSGIGREGVRFAVEEMTNLKLTARYARYLLTSLATIAFGLNAN